MPPAEAACSRAETARRLAALRQIPGNDMCAECHSRDTSWVVLDHGVFVCVLCAGAHRGLGTHISKVRSSQHDEFTPSEFEWLEALGNAKNANLYEGALPPTVRRPLPDNGAVGDVGCPNVVRRTWLRLKYDEQRFTVGTEHFAEALSHERCEGWLLKQGSLLPTWKRRFFSVRGDGRVLTYSKRFDGSTGHDDSSSSLRGYLPLAGCTIAVDEAEPRHLTLRTAAHADGGNGLGLGSSSGGSGGGGDCSSSSSSSTSTTLLRASTIQDAEMWVWALYQCGHAAIVRAAAETPEQSAACAAALGLPSVRKRRTLFQRSSAATSGTRSIAVEITDATC